MFLVVHDLIYQMTKLLYVTLITQTIVCDPNYPNVKYVRFIV